MAIDKSVDVAKIFPGPVLLLAGPGTGKTHQLARRIKYLIEEKEEKVSAENITVITFTGEAARNMRQRLSDEKESEVYVPPESQPRNIRTMHSIGYRIINDAYRKVGLKKEFMVIADKIRDILFADSARILGFSGEDGNLAEECRRYGVCEESSDKKCQICKKYQDLLRGMNAIDYDDQIFLACKLLEENPELLLTWQKSTQHLLVDEYQDINNSQYKLIRILCRDQEEGLFAVGDDDQSIYSWRGGSPTYIINFEEHFGQNAKVYYSLDECRRCPPHVLEAALAIVKKDNPDRLQKYQLHSINTEEVSKVSVFDVPSDKYEAKKICSVIASAPINQDALVLVPGHRFATPIKRVMRERGISYDCRSRVRTTGLSSLNNLFKWLRSNKNNFSLRICLEQIITNPNLNIPFEKLQSIKEKRERTLTKIAALWTNVISEKITLYEAIRRTIESENDLRFLFGLLEEIREAWSDSKKPWKFMETVCRIIRPWTSVKSLSEEVEDWVEDALARDVSAGEPMARVLTMAAAKGLGSDQVFIIGLNKGIIPEEGIDEEKLRETQRLLYVSMTRAKKKLHMFYSRVREGRLSFQPSPDGEGSGLLEPSPFLEWIPEENFEFEKKWSAKYKKT